MFGVRDGPAWLMKLRVLQDALAQQVVAASLVVIPDLEAQVVPRLLSYVIQTATIL